LPALGHFYLALTNEFAVRMKVFFRLYFGKEIDPIRVDKNSGLKCEKKQY